MVMDSYPFLCIQYTNTLIVFILLLRPRISSSVAHYIAQSASIENFTQSHTILVCGLPNASDSLQF